MPDSHVVVFDTNVLIPLILPASLSVRLLSRLRAAHWHVALSPHIMMEVRDKMLHKELLRNWLELTDEEIAEFLNRGLPGKTISVPGILTAPGAVPEDPRDDIIVATAMEADAAYVITEDNHLLTLGEYAGIKILSRLDFAAELDRLGVP